MPDWKHAGEDYEPADIGVEGFEIIDEGLMAQILADANQAVQDKKNAKAITETIIESIKLGVNLFRK